MSDESLLIESDVLIVRHAALIRILHSASSNCRRFSHRFSSPGVGGFDDLFPVRKRIVLIVMNSRFCNAHFIFMPALRALLFSSITYRRF